MSALSDITDAVAAGPASAGNKSENATAHSLRDLIALEKHRAANSAAVNFSGFLNAHTVKLVPPGGS